MNFCGSYRPDDVQFLLKQLPLTDFVTVSEKERLIQSGRRHYSEMLSPESLPSAAYLKVYAASYAANLPKMAADCLTLAALIAARHADKVTLVSLARAGTPVGVILKHLLEQVFSCPTTHYSISIVRDRGIDSMALRHVLAQGHAPASIVFVDGWTGKGVISRQLRKSIDQFNLEYGLAIDGGLHVLSDLAGTAACAASCDDYLIPSSILNATVSGLISRSILNHAIGPNDFHGCVYYSDFAAQDQSRAFADGLIAAGIERAREHGVPRAVPIDRVTAARVSTVFMAACMARYGISDLNLVKPGIGEATRVLLRRVPRLLLLRDAQAPDVAHLGVLAREKAVPVIVDPTLPYQAVSLIRNAIDA